MQATDFGHCSGLCRLKKMNKKGYYLSSIFFSTDKLKKKRVGNHFPNSFFQLLNENLNPLISKWLHRLLTSDFRLPTSNFGLTTSVISHHFLTPIQKDVSLLSTWRRVPLPSSVIRHRSSVIRLPSSFSTSMQKDVSLRSTWRRVPLPTSDFPLPSSVIRLPSPVFGLPSSVSHLKFFTNSLNKTSGNLSTTENSPPACRPK